jgi:pimeloyl-ACP methyl ester carboxylesterase
MTSNEWVRVQPEIAKFTLVCSYDRVGFGWSESGPPADPVNVLHVLLRNGKVPGPYAIVGHSYGSGLARRFTYRFPNDVKGIVLTATSYPDEEIQRIATDTSIRGKFLFASYAWSARFGLMRITPEKYLPEMLSVYFGLLRQYLPPRTAEREIAFLHQTRHVQSLMIERGHPTSEEDMEDVAACTRGFGDMPLVVLSERWVYSSPVTEQEKDEARREAERQTRLAGLSSRGKQIDLESGTSFLWNAPLRSSMQSEM